MKSRISALMDGELAQHEVEGTLDRLRAEGDARDTWRAYHLIGDSIRDTRLLSAGDTATPMRPIAPAGRPGSNDLLAEKWQ